jgi:glycosyltransferase involved in cell wall biosynthesis
MEQRLIRLVCSRISLGFVQAERLKDQFETLIPDSRIVSVYNAIDTDKYSNSDLDAYDSNVILYLGHLSHAKGYCDLLRVIPQIVEKHPHVRFCFAGEKIDRGRNIVLDQITGKKMIYEDPDACYRQYIKGRCEQNHIYLGVMGEKEKIDLLKHCNFLILPSYSEGFSMAVLEALSVGKPVVCTPVGALGEIITDGVNGFLVRAGDLRAIELAIERLLEDEKIRSQMGATNFIYARRYFSKKIIADQITGCFNDVIAASS